MGVLPLAPHLYFTQFLKDEDAQERATGIRFGMEWLEAADEVWVFGESISEGMAAEIKRAYPRRKPIKKTRKVEEAVDKPEDPVNDSDSDAGADTQLEAENSVGEAEDTTEENFPADDADALPWSEDTGQEKKNVQKDEPTDKTEQESSAAAKTPSAVTITKDDITAVIVAKIKKKRDNNEKIGRLLKTYGVAQLSDLPAEKYEAFLADVSQI